MIVMVFNTNTLKNLIAFCGVENKVCLKKRMGRQLS